MASMGDFLDGVVIGVHLLSAHSVGGMNDANTGLYVRAAGGATLGVYENSISGTELAGSTRPRRQSVYLGWTWETPGRAFGVTLGAVNGYGRDEQRTCEPDTSLPMATGRATVQATGPVGCSSSTYQPAVRDVLPLAVFSGRVPLASDWAARLGYVYVPGAFGDTHMHVANLMVERHF
jgi:hypothetical protein